MPKIQSPLFPPGTNMINNILGYMKIDGMITYFHGSMAVFSHREDDLATFRLITAQFYVNGCATQAEITRAFGVSKISVKRSVKRYLEGGSKSFFEERKRRGPAILTKEVLVKAQQLLNEGLEPSQVADRLEIKRDTLSKAIRAGRLHWIKKKDEPLLLPLLSTKSERSSVDCNAPMGVAATDVVGRLAASVGDLDAIAPDFTPALDVPNGGLLCAIPALLAVGLLDHLQGHLELPKGYYGIDSLLILLCFMALARLSSIEALRYNPPGEWGQLLGLDRIPEVRTLRQKIRLLAGESGSTQWGAALCEYWMQASPEQAGVVYVDGHVRVYHGSQTVLPRHYVARERLCMRATTDYWVNAMDGQPFMVVNQVVDPGLIHVVEHEIVPRLEKVLPSSLKKEPPDDNPHRHRFTIVFDREGYSPEFFKRMKVKRIACLTYHKFPAEPWPEEEFIPTRVCLVSGEEVTQLLAERGTCLKNGLWVRELRKLTERGHQTSILSTDYCAPGAILAAWMFARWSQENFFKYAREHFGLDRLADYRTDEISDPIRVVNPDYRQLDSQVRSDTGKLNRRLAEFAKLSLDETIEPEHVEPYMRRKAELQEEISAIDEQLIKLKAQRKATEHHITIDELPKELQFRKLATQSKSLLDIIKMIAYRAETAMANCLRPFLKRPDEARCVLRSLYTMEADIHPDSDAKTLTVRLHHNANVASDKIIEKLCEELNATETIFPRTDLRLILKVGSEQIP